MDNFLCLGCDDKNLGESFEWGGGTSIKIPRFNEFSRNVNMNLKILPHMME